MSFLKTEILNYFTQKMVHLVKVSYSTSANLIIFWNCNSAFFALFSSRDVEWGYFLAICRIELSNSATLHIVKLHDFWSFGRVCLISHSGLLKKNKPDLIPIGILPTQFMKYIQGQPNQNNLHKYANRTLPGNMTIQVAKFLWQFNFYDNSNGQVFIIIQLSGASF